MPVGHVLFRSLLTGVSYTVTPVTGCQVGGRIRKGTLGRVGCWPVPESSACWFTVLLWVCSPRGQC